MIARDSFDIQGEISSYAVLGDSGKQVYRYFCSRCGSGVYLEGDADPGFVFLKVGSLDDASWVKPDMHIYTAAKQPWIQIGDTLPRYEKAPDE